ncbi:phosphotransferase [Microbispora bryophytorum]|nr:phosphotransferase [Microbispora bryophytorum]
MTERLIRLLARHLPGYEVRSVERLGEGQDNAAYEINGELVIRQSKIDDSAPHNDSAPHSGAGPHNDTVLHRDAAPRDDTTFHRDPAQHGGAVQHGDPARQRDPVPHGDSASRAEVVRREAALLVVVSEVSPLPVPRPIFVDAEAGVLAYRKLPGRPLNLHPVREPARLAAPLGAFLSALHVLPVGRMEDLVPRDAFPLRDLREEAEGDYEKIADRLPAEERRLVEEFFAAEVPPDPETLTFCHNDLGSEHLLVDVETSAVTGVVDWTDAAIADPAYDLALVYRDLGPEVYGRTLAHYQGHHDDADHERMLFYARCALLEDVAYGLCTGIRPYAEAGLAHLGRTFS